MMRNFSGFTGHEGQDSIVIRGSMHHAIMTVSEFSEWLIYENCTATRWLDIGGKAASCLVKRDDGSVRCTAMKLYAEQFEPVY